MNELSTVNTSRSAQSPSSDGDFDEERGGIDLGGLMLFLRRRWKLIVGTALITGLLAALVVLQVTPRYTATSSVAIETQKTQVVNIDEVVSGMVPDVATMETQAEILRSREILGKLARELDLLQDPEFNPARASGSGEFSLLRPASWFGGGEEPAEAGLSEEEQLGEVVDRLGNAVTITPERLSYVIRIRAESEDREKAARIANALADLYIDDGLEAKYEATRRASEYLQSRVEELRGQALAADQATESYRAQAGLVGSEEGSTVAAQQLGELNTQLINARAERAAKEAQLQQIRSLAAGGGDGGIEASGAILASPLIQRLREQESEVVRNLAQLRATYGERHPRILNSEAELRDLRGKIADEVRKLAASTANEVAVARARENALQASLQRIESTVSTGSQAGVRLRELQRESEANKSVYETFLNRLKETRQAAELQTPDARLVSSAATPENPSFPNVKATIGLALFLGFAGGLGLAFGAERLDNTIRSSATLEKIGGGAALAFVPVVRGRYAKPENVVLERPESMVPEALRTLRSSLALSDVDNPPQLVMLTSSVPGEGKTFISTGLARVTAQSGARTILVDADMRHPRVHKALDLENECGLVQVLSQHNSLAEATRVDEATGLHVLTAGRGAANPPDLLRSGQMANLLLTLRQQYEFIVIDSPPFVPLTDSQILAHQVDKMLLVVRWGSVPVTVVENTLKQARRVNAPLVGSVLSQVNFDRHARYGYGDYGYHYSRYSGYYGTAE